MASHQHGQCCCDCPTKAESGLPDSLVTSFSGLTSTAVGMPADEEAGECAGADPYYMRFTHSAAFMELLSSITFDYVEAATSDGCGTCCFRYEGRSEYTADCAGETSGPWILFGDSPFGPYVIGGSSFRVDHSGTPTPCDPADYVGSECCEDACDGECVDLCPLWMGFDTTGAVYTPQPIHGTADLVICVEGMVVTVCITLAMQAPCTATTSSVTNEIYLGSPNSEPPCFEDYFTDPSTTAICAGASTITVLLTATVDLTAVSGADIWEKMKNATNWTSSYEQVGCSCGGGCLDDYEHFDCGCTILGNCFCLETGCATPDIDGPYPVDQECLYAAGEIDLAFADE